MAVMAQGSYSRVPAARGVESMVEGTQAKASCRQRVLSVLVAGALLLAAGLATFFQLGHGITPLTSNLRKAVEEREEAHDCTAVEQGVDYVTTEQLGLSENVLSAKQCRSKCEETKRCGAWTWGVEEHMTGVTHVCFMKQLDVGFKPMRVAKWGVISGYPCSSDEAKKAKLVFFSTSTSTTTVGSSYVWKEVTWVPTTASGTGSGTTTTTSAWWWTTQAKKATGTTSTTSAWWWTTSSTTPGATPDCTHTEENVDYWTSKTITKYGIEDVKSPGACRAKCKANADCGAFTWGAARGLPGITDVCWLKELGEKEVPIKHHKYGVVSGVTCPSNSSNATSSSNASSVSGSSNASSVSGSMAHPAHSGHADKAPHSGHADEASTTTLVTSSTTTPLTTSSTTTLPWVAAGSGELYCFALMLPFGYEPKLLAMQYEQGVSLFACDEYAVYSNKSMEIAHGLASHVVPINLKCEFGGEFGTALNTAIFRAIWIKVVSEARFKLYKWSVKVDPDCVFLPNRLRHVLRSHTEGERGTYLNNCKFGMHGPIEVFSNKAVETLVNGWDHCDRHFRKLCSGDCWWGEDLFIDQCMKRVLDVQRDNEYKMLTEDHCDAPKGWKDCLNHTVVAFHPFKSSFDYQECLNNANMDVTSVQYFK